ncbi:RNA polymerase sigma factor CarQ [Saliniradius amylolyticus]|uniref:RNA polymerase sigma factor CarQ n=1 Tax=Saliniradius amylolyticus TaxID=2183582 RepID=A0A2S2E6N7_9ALTE|nr:RNA polymerase sigma factor [Saliniradius amylolyticus]AWL12637.1 RNA polymerase sigma factor CarQ [Saliniradius amylolyticus]
MQQGAEVIQAQNSFVDKTEQALIKACIDGDMSAYQQLYERHVGKVHALCWRLTGDKGMAEDATQEVFIQIWRKLGNFQGQSRFSTWLHSVTSNVCISYMRKQKGWLGRIFNIEDTDAANEPAPAQTHEIDLDALVSRLPERARVVFVLHAIEGYRHEEVAKMTGMAVGSSKAQFHRAKQMLKEWVNDE